jgi:hypothetical protein
LKAPRKRRRWLYLVAFALLLASLPFLWLVTRDAVHLAFADEEETQRIVYNVLIPGLYAALDRSDRLPSPKPRNKGEAPVISLGFVPTDDALPPCFDLLRVEIAPRYATEPSLAVAKEWAEHSLRRPWSVLNADVVDYDENIALSFSPIAISAYRACIEATPFSGMCAKRLRTNLTDRGHTLNDNRVRLYAAARILDGGGRPTDQYCALSASPPATETR